MRLAGVKAYLRLLPGRRGPRLKPWRTFRQEGSDDGQCVGLGQAWGLLCLSWETGRIYRRLKRLLTLRLAVAEEDGEGGSEAHAGGHEVDDVGAVQRGQTWLS